MEILVTPDSSKHAIGILSTIKAVYKEYTQKRIYHEKNHFTNYILGSFKLIAGLDNILFNAIQQIPSLSGQLSFDQIENILEA